MCHSIAKGAPNQTGPNLFGVAGRRIGSKKDFVYSRSLTAHQGLWTEAELDSFLESPQMYAPGTKMAFGGIKDKDVRAEVIEALRSLR